MAGDVAGRRPPGLRVLEGQPEAGGFKFQARIINYPGGKPGDVGLFFAWPKDSLEALIAGCEQWGGHNEQGEKAKEISVDETRAAPTAS